jgi:2-methylcitrate dehydratase PrpD
MDQLTAGIAKFVASLAPDQLPETCRAAARTGLVDCVGVMIAGAAEPAVRLVSRTVSTAAANDGAPEIPSGRPLSAGDAALVNGVAAHALDYDDVGMDGHPSAIMVPAILADGWVLGASGAEAVAAYVAGYEVWALLGAREPGILHERGFHPTAVMGTLAAAAACARLNGLDEERTIHALAIAASMAAGLVANFGSMTKPLHVGRGAQAAVFAVQLARAGFTGSRDALEHPAGFMHAHSPSGGPKVDADDWGLGRDWRLPALGLNVKRYPMCYATHRSIDAMLELVTAHDLAPEDVARIDVRIGETQDLMLRNRAPRTGLEAKFSMEFAMAAALVARRVGLGELTDDFVRRADVCAAMEKVTRATTAERMADMPFAPDDRVSVRLRNGETIAHPPVARPKGSWQRPLTVAELEEKFLDCAGGALGQARAGQLFAGLHGIERVASLRDLPLVAAA